MDAAAQLALMAKAKLVFETPGSFLSFPVLAPLSFHPAQLDFSKALTDPTHMAALRDFSLAVNRCPSDPVARASEDDYLWDRYDAWLNAMELATSSLDAGSQAAYDAARALLVTTDSNGVEVDSPVVVAYKQCRDAVIDAEQAFKAAQLSATNAGSADVLSEWQTVDAPKLREAIDNANANWIAVGHKADVEAARATLAQCEARRPSATWNTWRTLYTPPKADTPSIDCITDPKDNFTFPPSGFTPADLVNQAWTPLQLSAAEIATLVSGAPQELRALFGDISASSITSISFEFRSAAVVRPWFSPAMFATRFWKFGDSTQLSDGAAPPVGLWPAYVSAVVFARNVQVTYAQAPTRPLLATELLHLAVPPPPPPKRVVFNPAILKASQFEIMGGKGSAGAVSPAIKTIATKPVLSLKSSVSAVALSPAVAAAKPVAPVPAPIAPTSSLLRLNAAAYRIPIDHIPIVVKPAPTPSAPAPAPSAPPAPPDDSIAVLAFICNSVPKSPNPDPALTWTS